MCSWPVHHCCYGELNSANTQEMHGYCYGPWPCSQPFSKPSVRSFWSISVCAAVTHSTGANSTKVACLNPWRNCVWLPFSQSRYPVCGVHAKCYRLEQDQDLSCIWHAGCGPFRAHRLWRVLCFGLHIAGCEGEEQNWTEYNEFHPQALYWWHFISRCKIFEVYP